MRTYAVSCAHTQEMLGYIGMDETFATVLDRREHDEATHDIMFTAVTGEDDVQVWESELVVPIRSVEQFDRWMNGSLV